ncbi:MFS transporter [uncultured Maricaulis sp.]|uniref:MFS transporter n=1 Tax=uncultured Maricaulis sp. TaxID=174710 RepID=UPI0026137DE9|nr:MFS transporter [uncultured Maricaulis sp.]
MTDTASPISAPPLKYISKLLYGVGSMAYGVKDVAFRAYLLWYYNYVIGAEAALVSLAILVALVFDAVSDPIVGQISDSLRTKWGRRHPLMYLSAIPAAASFFFLWHPPSGIAGWDLVIYLAVLSSAVRTFITLYEIPSSALAPELSTHYDDRTSIASYRYFFGYLGGIGMSVLALWIWLAPTEEYPIGQLNPAGYYTFGLVGSLLMFATVMISTVGTHHRIKYLRKLPPPERRNPFGTLKLMAKTFGNRAFLAILSFGVLKYTAIGMASALSLYFGTLFWGFNSAELAIMAADPLLGAFLALIFAPIISKRIGKRAAAFVLTIAAILFGITPFILRLNGLFFDDGDPALLPTLFVIQAIYSACGISSAILVHAMIGDVIDDSDLKTGRRAEGLFYAANSFMQKCVTGFGLMAAGILLTIVDLPERAQPADVDPASVDMLAILYVPSVAFLYIAGALFLHFYRLDRASHEANLAALKLREEGAPHTQPGAK